MPAVTAKRPALVTVVAVLTVISGIVSLLAGFVWLFLPPEPATNGGVWRLVGMGYVLVGVVELVVARGLFRGNATARVVFAVAAVVNLVLSVVGATTSGTARGLSFVDVVLVIIAVVVLYTPKANAFFGRSPT